MFASKGGLVVLVLVLWLVPLVGAIPSGGRIPPSFTHRGGYWYDDWGLTRDEAEGDSGYLPGLFSETTGSNAELAYSVGEGFRGGYPDNNSMASAILGYVQRWTTYGYDEDNVVMGGVAQGEWAWNADEMAHSMDENLGLVAVGDCEDLAFLSATIYAGAGYETAIVDTTDHVALLVWLPDYPNANVYWDLSGDDRGAGWVWVEATGSENPVGWTPSEYFDGIWSAYVYDGGTYHEYEPLESVAGSGSIDLDLVFVVAFLLLIIIFRIFRR